MLKSLNNSCVQTTPTFFALTGFSQSWGFLPVVCNASFFNHGHIFHRLGVGAGRGAAGVPGCGGGAESPLSEQTSRLPARPARGQDPHRPGGRQLGGRLWLQWVYTTGWGLSALPVLWWENSFCMLSLHASIFIGPDKCSLTFEIYSQLAAHLYQSGCSDNDSSPVREWTPIMENPSFLMLPFFSFLLLLVCQWLWDNRGVFLCSPASSL